MLPKTFFTGFLFILVLFSLHVAAAEKDSSLLKGIGIEANVIGGRVFRHSAAFKPPVPDFSGGFDINMMRKTYGKKSWQQRRHYPTTGVGFTYLDYGIDSIYGKAFGLYLNLDIPIVRKDNWEWTIRIGSGLAYVTRKYERLSSWDTINNAIGSHINDFTLFATQLRYHVSPQLDLQAGANFSHISNAAFRQPNLGVNVYGAHIGLCYFPVSSNPPKIVRALPALPDRWLVQLRLGLSFKEVGSADGPRLPVYIASLYTSKRIMSRNKIFAGIDYSYHDNIYAFLRNNEIHIGEEHRYSTKGAVFIGNEFLFGKFGLLLQLGFYYKQAYTSNEKIYQKLGYVFYLLQEEKGFLKELQLSALLKTHLGQAEFAEMGLGFGF